jgi:CotS family spore coat protein
MLLREYRRSIERINFLHGMLTFLQGEGLAVEQIYPTAEGNLLTGGEDEVHFWLVTSFHGAECGTRDRDDVLAAVRSLARLHATAARHEAEVPEMVTVGMDEPLLLCEKHNRELRRVQNYIRNKKKKNEFEVLFAGQYDAFMKKALAVTEQMREHLSGDLMRGRVAGFCHGDFNQHQVIFTGEDTAIVHFEHFRYQDPIGDLANFVRKILEKNNWNTGLGLDMIRAYDAGRRLSPADLCALFDSLAYPEKFWKVANRYFNGHKAWLSGREVDKLKKLIKQEENREQFLEILYHFHGN